MKCIDCFYLDCSLAGESLNDDDELLSDVYVRGCNIDIIPGLQLDLFEKKYNREVELLLEKGGVKKCQGEEEDA